jgi:hypothetical protein
MGGRGEKKLSRLFCIFTIIFLILTHFVAEIVSIERLIVT